jgi:hypothetical protein
VTAFYSGRFRHKKCPGSWRGRPGLKSLYNQFGRVVTECHIFCESGNYYSGRIKSSSCLAKKSPTALEVVSCGAKYSFSGGFEEGCLGFPCHRKSSAYLQVAATATL